MPGLTLLAQATRQALDRWDRIRGYFYRGVPVPRVAQTQRDHRDIMAALSSYLRYVDGE